MKIVFELDKNNISGSIDQLKRVLSDSNLLTYLNNPQLKIEVISE